MNFFQHQERTRRKTKFLVLLFALAVIAIITALYFVLALVFVIHAPDRMMHFSWWQPDVFGWVSLGTSALIFGGSLYKIQQLSSGGSAIALMMGGQPLDVAPTEPYDKKLRNVVEEMALASGTPVPRIFVLRDEGAVNAFAAGFTPSDAAVGVTQGTIKLLTRDELQGVIAHEFSHILNGDMRLNLRLIGLLHGIFIIGLTGQWLLRGTRGNRKGSGGLALAGLALMAIGYIGFFFGKLIQCAVSRQREFLADASAVQFTRNPQGIAGALKKIGGFKAGSRLMHFRTREVSHLMFVNALRASWFSLTSTHPPLKARIKAIDPSFDGDMTQISVTRSAALPTAGLAGFSAQAATPNDEVLIHIGNPTAMHVSYVHAFIDALPATLAVAVRERSGSRAVVYSLLLDPNGAIQEKQLIYLRSQLNPEFFSELERLRPGVQRIGPQGRLPLLDLAVPALRQMSIEEYRTFTKHLGELSRADGQVSLFEYTLMKILSRHLGAHFKKPRKGNVRFRTLEPILPDCIALLSALAYAGASDSVGAHKAFERGIFKLTAKSLPILESSQASLKELNASLSKIADASASLKKEILEAAVATAGSDGALKVEEAEMLRAIGDTIDCPIPPILNVAGTSGNRSAVV